MARMGVFAAVAVVAVVALGCGGSDDEPSADTSSSSGTSAAAWADDVCSSLVTWQNVVTEAGSTLNDPKDLSVNALKDVVEGVVDATATLVTDVADLGPPDTDAGDAAQTQLKSLSDDLESQADVMSKAIATDSDTVTELLANLSTFTGALSSMKADVETTLKSIDGLDGGAELKDAFADAENCQQLESAG